MKNILLFVGGAIVVFLISFFIGINIAIDDTDYKNDMVYQIDKPIGGVESAVLLSDKSQSVVQSSQKEFYTQSFGGVITLDIPSECIIDGAAGSGFVTCPTKENPTPIPDMVVTTDGFIVDIKKWEGRDTDFYQKVISTLKVKTPLNRSIKISIE